MLVVCEAVTNYTICCYNSNEFGFDRELRQGLPAVCIGIGTSFQVGRLCVWVSRVTTKLACGTVINAE